METKTAKITSVQENLKSYNGKNGLVFVHGIQFDTDIDKKTWEYHSLKQQCEKFKVGESSTFEVDIQVNGNYTNYKIKPAKEANASFASKQAPKDQGIITYLSCFSSSVNFFANKLSASEEDVFAMTEKAFEKALSKTTLNK